MRRARLALETLGERIVPAFFTWTGNGANNNASTAANWLQNAVPSSGDTVQIYGNAGPNSNKNITFDTAFLADLAKVDLGFGYMGSATVDGNMDVDNWAMTGQTLYLTANTTLAVTDMDLTGTVSGVAGSKLLFDGTAPRLHHSGIATLALESVEIPADGVWDIDQPLTLSRTPGITITQNGTTNWTGSIINATNLDFNNAGTFNDSTSIWVLALPAVLLTRPRLPPYSWLRNCGVPAVTCILLSDWMSKVPRLVMLAESNARSPPAHCTVP